MKTFRNIILCLACLLIGATAQAQTTGAKALVDQGVALNDQGKFADAIVKYDQAIKLDPAYASAYYEKAYTLFTSGKGNEAIPLLEKVLALNPQFAGAYDMLGSIYDDMKQGDKAIEYYQKGVKIDPNYQRLHYNLAISYYRQGKYPEAETSAINAIKLDPKHASSLRIYALAEYTLQKRAVSLMSWCNFLLIEPKTARSAEAMTYVKNIVNFGISKKDSKTVNINVSPDNPANMMMPIAVIAATESKTNLSGIDSLELQLTSLFKVAHTVAMDKDLPFVSNFFSNYFDKLANSGNMPAFTRYISLSVYNDADVAWFKQHQKELGDFQTWINTTRGVFEILSRLLR